MRVMALQAGIIPRTDVLMHGNKPCLRNIMTSGAEQAALFLHNTLMHGGMGIMAGRAFLCCRIMGNPILPVFGHFLMAAETKSGLFLRYIFLMHGTMGQMAGAAVQILHRRVHDSGGTDLFLRFAMAAKTLPAGIFFHIIDIIARMG